MKALAASFLAVLLLLPFAVAGLNVYRRNVQINNGVASNVCEFLQFKKEVAASLQRPGIFLFGFGNVLMGVRAEQLSRSLGLPVMNFGVIANMHNGMAYEALERELRRGDSVLLALPYWYFDADTRIDGQETLIRDLVFSCHVTGFSRLPLRYKLKFLLLQRPSQIIEGVTRRLFNGWWIAGLSRTGLFTVAEKGGTFNHHGDYETMLTALRTPQMLERVSNSPQPLDRYVLKDQSDGVRELRRFVGNAKKIGVKLIATWPVAYAPPTEHLPAIFEQVAKLYESLGIEVLGSPTDFIYPLDAFADSSNHLTREGSRQHTEQVSDLLKTHFANSAGTAQGPIIDADHPQRAHQ